MDENEHVDEEEDLSTPNIKSEKETVESVEPKAPAEEPAEPISDAQDKDKEEVVVEEAAEVVEEAAEVVEEATVTETTENVPSEPDAPDSDEKLPETAPEAASESAPKEPQEPMQIYTSDAIKEKLARLDELSAEEISDVLYAFGVEGEEGVLEFNDPAVGAKFAARYQDLTGGPHKVFNEEAGKVIRRILDNKDALIEFDGERYNSTFFRNMIAIGHSVDADRKIELVSTFPGKQGNWNLKSPQLMSTEEIESMMGVAGRRLAIADQENMYFDGHYDLITLARANEIYRERTGQSHPRYEELLPELVKKERALLLDPEERKKQPLSKLKMGRAIVDAYDFEEVDLAKELFTDEERKGMALRDERAEGIVPEDRKGAELLLTNPEVASLEGITFMLDHIGPEKYVVGQDEIEGLIDIDTIEKLNEQYKQFTGGKSHPRYLTVVPALIKQEKALEGTTDERKAQLDSLDKKIGEELEGDKPLVKSGERFNYASHEKTDFERMMLDLDHAPTDMIATKLNELVMGADERAVTVDDLATITRLRGVLAERGAPVNTEVELFLTRVANAKNQSKQLEEKAVDAKVDEERKGNTIVTGRGAAVLVTAEMFGKIGRGVVHLVGKAMNKIKEIRKRNLEKKQERMEATSEKGVQTQTTGNPTKGAPTSQGGKTSKKPDDSRDAR